MHTNNYGIRLQGMVTKTRGAIHFNIVTLSSYEIELFPAKTEFVKLIACIIHSHEQHLQLQPIDCSVVVFHC